MEISKFIGRWVEKKAKEFENEYWKLVGFRVNEKGNAIAIYQSTLTGKITETEFVIRLKKK